MDPQAVTLEGGDGAAALAADSADESPPNALHSASRIWLLLSFAAVSLLATAEGAPSILLAYLLFGGIGLLWASLVSRADGRLFLCVFGGASLVAVLLFLHLRARWGVPYWQGGSDEVHFEAVGRQFAESFGVTDYPAIRRELVAPTHNSVAYVYIVGMLFKLAMVFGGIHTMVPRLFNAACLGMLSVGIHRLGLDLRLRTGTAQRAALVVGYFPLMIWVAGQTLRETIVAGLFVALALAWSPGEAGWRRGRTAIAHAWTLLILLALVDLRLPQAFAAILIAVGCLLVGGALRSSVARAAVAVAAVAAGIVLYVKISQVLALAGGRLMEEAVYYESYRAQDMGGGLSAVVFTASMPLGLVLRVAYALVSPLPTASSDLDALALSAGTVLQIACLPFLFRGLGAFRREPAWASVFVSFAVLFLGMALITFSGRHIVQYFPFGVLIAAIGYERMRDQRWLVVGSMAIVGLFLGATYAVLKL